MRREGVGEDDFDYLVPLPSLPPFFPMVVEGGYLTFLSWVCWGASWGRGYSHLICKCLHI